MNKGFFDCCQTRRKTVAWQRWTVWILVLIALCISVLPIRAEMRTYTQIDMHAISISSKSSIDLFFKYENRFRQSGLVLNKVFIGLKPKIYSWLYTQVYYANKDLNYTKHQNKHLLVAELYLRLKKGRTVFLNRIGNEWHVTDDFYRYRNYSEIKYKFPVYNLFLWSSEEWRFDADEKRINMNDVRLGIGWAIKKKMTLKTFFDIESKRRLKNNWTQKPFLGIALSVKPLSD